MFAYDYQLTSQASFTQCRKEGQRDVDDFVFVHLAYQQNNYPATGGNVKSENIAEAARRAEIRSVWMHSSARILITV